MKRLSGFTLIELVIVIVILGVLAATAAPKYIDMTRDARIAKLEYLQGAIMEANDIVFSKTYIDGVHETKIVGQYEGLIGDYECDPEDKPPELPSAEFEVTVTNSEIQSDACSVKYFIEGLDNSEQWIVINRSNRAIRAYPQPWYDNRFYYEGDDNDPNNSTECYVDYKKSFMDPNETKAGYFMRTSDC